MIKHGKTALLAALIIPGAVLAQIDVGKELGTTETAIRAALEVDGYTATEFEIEVDEIEVEATRDGKTFEFEISPETGLVLAAYQDDDEGEDDDDEEEEEEDYEDDDDESDDDDDGEDGDDADDSDD